MNVNLLPRSGRDCPQPRPGEGADGSCQRGSGGLSARLGIVGCQITTESETPMTSVIEADGLTKRFGTTQALAGVDIAADRGQVLALLGPNGAGKTTIVRVLATLLRPDSGQARICGYDVLADAVQVRQLIALTRWPAGCRQAPGRSAPLVPPSR